MATQKRVRSACKAGIAYWEATLEDATRIPSDLEARGLRMAEVLKWFLLNHAILLILGESQPTSFRVLYVYSKCTMYMYFEDSNIYCFEADT